MLIDYEIEVEDSTLRSLSSVFSEKDLTNIFYKDSDKHFYHKDVVRGIDYLSSEILTDSNFKYYLRRMFAIPTVAVISLILLVVFNLLSFLNIFFISFIVLILIEWVSTLNTLSQEKDKLKLITLKLIYKDIIYFSNRDTLNKVLEILNINR